MSSNWVSEARESLEIFHETLLCFGCVVLYITKCRSYAAVSLRKCIIFKEYMLIRRYASFNNMLSVSRGNNISIGEDVSKNFMFKYIWQWIHSDFRTDSVERLLDNNIAKGISLIDESTLSAPVKSRILNPMVCSKTYWIVMVHNINCGQLHKCKRLFHAISRKRIGLGKPCGSSIHYHSREHSDLDSNDFHEYTSRLRVMIMHILECSKDWKIHQRYCYLLKRDRNLGGMGGSLHTFIPKKLPCKQLTLNIYVENSDSQLTF